MATRTLEFIVKGNAGGGQTALRAFGKDAQVVQQQVQVMSTQVAGHTTTAANKMVKSTSRLIKATAGMTGVTKGAVKGIAGMGASFVAASAGTNALASATGFLPGPIGLAAGAAIAGALAIWKLHDSESAAERSARRLAAAQAAVGVAVKHQIETATGQAKANLNILVTQRSLEDSTKKLSHLRASLAGIEKASGTGSKQYRDTLILLRQAEIGAADAGAAHTAAKAKGIRATKEQAAAIPEEIKSLEKRRAALKAELHPINQQAVGLEQSKRNARELGIVEDQLAAKISGAAGKHREAGRAAADMAKAIGGATPVARRMRDQLNLLSRQQIAKANKIDAVNAVTKAAGDAAGRVRDLIASLLTLNRTPVRIPAANLRLPPGDPRNRGRSTQELGSGGIVGRFRPRGTIEDRVSAQLAGMGRNDDLQDKQTRSTAEAAARAGGVTDPDAIRLRGERAVLARRKAETAQRAAIVKKGLAGVRRALVTRLKERTGLYAALRKIPASKKKAHQDARQKLLERISKKNDQIEALYGQERGLMDEQADLAAEAADLGFDIGALDVEIAATPTTSVPGDLGGSAGDAGGGGGASAAEANVALADLTPGTADDISTRQALLAEEQAALEAAKAKGDNDAIIRLASSIKSLQDAIAGLTGAVQDNTTSQEKVVAGSGIFGFRGESFHATLGPGRQSSDSLLDVGVGV